MPVQVKCPSCSTVLRLPDALPAGGSVRCPKCKTVLRVPGKTPASQPAPAPAKPPASRVQATPPSAPKAAVKRPASPSIQPTLAKAPPRIASEANDVTTTKTGSKKGLLFGILGCAGLLFLVCGGTITYGVYRLYRGGKEFVQEVRNQVEQAAQKKKTVDVAFIHADCNSAIVFQLARIHQSKSSLLPPPDKLDKLVDETIKETGIDLRKVEQLIAVTEPIPQGEKPADPRASRRPPPGWRTYSSADGRFSVFFPSAPKVSKSRDAQGTATQNYQATARGGLLNYQVVCTDPPKGTPAAPAQFYFDQLAAAFGPSVKGKKPIEQNGLRGMEFDMEMKQGRITVKMINRAFVVGTRLYQVTAFAPKGQENAVQFRAYLDSFQPQSSGGSEDAPLRGAGIVRFTESVNGRQVLDQLLKQSEEANAAGKTYYRSKSEKAAGAPLAGHVADERTLVVAPEPMLRKMLAAPNVPTPLRDKLREFELDNDVFGVTVVEPFKAQLKESLQAADLPPQLAKLKSIDQDLVAVRLIANLNSDKLLQVTLEGKNEQSASNLEETSKNALDMGKAFYPFLKGQVQKDVPPEWTDLVNEYFKVMDQILTGGIKVTKEGKNVVLTLEKPH